MKPLTLTEEQEAKLLEMCKVLFPEYTVITFRKGTNPWAEEYVFFGKHEKQTGIDIHWFEFCMTHLVEAISEKSEWKQMPIYVKAIFPGAEGEWSFYTEFLFHYPKESWIKHPVDCLYTQFQSLKLKK